MSVRSLIKIPKHYDHGTDKEDYINENITDLMLAAKFGTIKNNIILVKLLCQNSNVNEKDNFDDNALMFAIENYRDNKNRANIEVIKILLDYKIDVNNVNCYQVSPLLSAIYINEIELIELLISRGANIDFSSFRQDTLNYVFEEINDNEKILLILFKYNIIFDKEHKHYTKLVTFMKKYKDNEFVHPYYIKHIKSSNDILNKQDNYGRTLLMKCLDWKKIHNAKLLLEKGVDINITDSYSKTAKDYCIENKIDDHEILELLKVDYYDHLIETAIIKKDCYLVNKILTTTTDKNILFKFYDADPEIFKFILSYYDNK